MPPAQASGQPQCTYFWCRPICCAPWRLGVGDMPTVTQSGQHSDPGLSQESLPRKPRAPLPLGPSLEDLPSYSWPRAENPVSGDQESRGHVVELGGALGTPSSLTAPSHVSPRAASPSRPSTTSPSPRSTRRSWWTSRRWVAGGPAWPVVGRAAAASPLGPGWGPGAQQSRACR